MEDAVAFLDPHFGEYLNTNFEYTKEIVWFLSGYDDATGSCHDFEKYLDFVLKNKPNAVIISQCECASDHVYAYAVKEIFKNYREEFITNTISYRIVDECVQVHFNKKHYRFWFDEEKSQPFIDILPINFYELITRVARMRHMYKTNDPHIATMLRLAGVPLVDVKLLTEVFEQTIPVFWTDFLKKYHHLAVDNNHTTG